MDIGLTIRRDRQANRWAVRRTDERITIAYRRAVKYMIINDYQLLLHNN